MPFSWEKDSNHSSKGLFKLDLRLTDVLFSISISIFPSFQDILNELPPTSPPEASTGGGGGGGLSPSQAGPDRSHGANSTLHKLLLTKRNDPVGMGSRPSPVRSPEQNKNKTLEKLKSSLSASNPLLSQQLSRSVDSLLLQ